MIHPDLAGVRTLIFDMDGTLISSGKIALKSLRNGLTRFYQQYGETAPEMTDEQLVAGIGAPSDVFYRSLLDDKHLDDWEEFRAIIFEEEHKQLQTERITYPGTIHTLETLRRRGYKLALVSNCGSSYLNAVIDTQNIRRHLDRASCIGDRQRSTKAEHIADTVRELGGRAAVIGDRAYDVEAAHANDLPAVGALYGYGSRDELFGTATWVEDIRHLLFLFNPVRELGARIAVRANELRPLDKPFVIALDTPHPALSFPLTQHILNELTDLNVISAAVRMADMRIARHDSDTSADWIHQAYPWNTVSELLRERKNGMIDMSLPLSDGTRKPLRSRAGNVVLVTGTQLTGSHQPEQFDLYVKLEAKPATLSRLLKSQEAIKRFAKLAGALSVPDAAQPEACDLWQRWQAWGEQAKSLYTDATTSQAVSATTRQDADLNINGDALQRGEIVRINW
ncbi:HAD family hydrolase [bacterium]|nr:HAD family hydrolase [bacterium]